MKKLIVLPITLVLTLLIVSTIACGGSQTVITYCAAGCLTSQLGDGTCDDACNNAACSYDSGDCTECAPDCPQSWVGNGYCNYKCNNAACSYDGGDCSYSQPTKQPTATQQSGYCSANCMWSWVGDGECDSSLGCNVAACNYDGGDCNSQSNYCATGCPYSWVGDGYCDGTCNNYACNYDGGDCPMYGDLCVASDGRIGIYDSAGDCRCCANDDSNYYMDTDCGGSNCGAATNGVCCCIDVPTPTPTPAPACRTGYSQAVNDPSMCCPDGIPYYWASDGMCHATAPPAWRENIRSGDLVLNPLGAYTLGHVGICYGNGYIIEAKKDGGVTKTPIAEWDDTPGIYVLRVDCSDDVAAEAADLALTQLGKSYWLYINDKSDSMSSETWYCSELVWAVYRHQGIDLEYTPDNSAVTPLEIYMSTQIIYHEGPPDIILD